MKKRTFVQGGNYYGETVSGQLVPMGDVEVPPDAVVCRRVVDFPRGIPPPAALVVACDRCGASVATNPNGPHRDRPRVCMQCAHIEPLPL